MSSFLGLHLSKVLLIETYSRISRDIAVGAFGGIYILSTLSTTGLEDVRKAAPNTTLWFQLYIYKDR